MDKKIFVVFFVVLHLNGDEKSTVHGNIFSGLVGLFTSKGNGGGRDNAGVFNRHKRITIDEGFREKPLKTSDFVHHKHRDEIKRRDVDVQDSSSSKSQQTRPVRKDIFRKKKRRNLLTTAFGSPDSNITLIEQSAKLKNSNDKGDEYIDAENVRLGRSRFEKINSREEKEMSSIKTISSFSVPVTKFIDDDSSSGDEDIPLTEAFEWPKGRYGLPKSIYGCPKTFGVSWETGFRYHDTEDDGTENQRSDVFHLAANFSEDGISHEFCIKDDIDGEGDWPPGKYCIYKRGSSCPTNLKEGFVLWDDENTDNQNDKGGALPSGQYTEDTKIYFCCSTTGFVDKEISLPAKRPFFLFAYESARCQKVLNMKVTSEFIKFDDEDHGNTDYEYGEYPYGIHRFQKDHMLFLCFYEPSKPVVSYFSEAALTTNLEDENMEDNDQESLRQGEKIMEAFMKETGGIEDSMNKKERAGKTIIKTIKIPVHAQGNPIAIVLGLVLGSIVIGTAIIFMAKLVMYNSKPLSNIGKNNNDKVETTWTDPNIDRDRKTTKTKPKVVDHNDESERDSEDDSNYSYPINKQPDTWSDLDEDTELVEDQLLPDSELKSGLELLFLKQQRHYWNQRRQHQRKEDRS